MRLERARVDFRTGLRWSEWNWLRCRCDEIRWTQNRYWRGGVATANLRGLTAAIGRRAGLIQLH